MASIALIEPRPPALHVFSFVALPRLGLPSIGTVLRNLGHQVQIHCQVLRKLPMAEILKADVVGISTTTSTAPEAYRIADLCRSRGVPVLIGGVHATFRPEEALEHADCCVMGEAEEMVGEAVERLLDQARSGAKPDGGLLLPEEDAGEGNICRVPDLDTLPMPDLSLIRGWRDRRLTPMVTSRGCPYDCSFCSVTPMFGRAYRFRSAGLVLDEIAHRQPRGIFFYDDNFTANPTRTRELLEGMIRLPRPPFWIGQVRSDVTQDPELIDLMQASRCARVFVGYESISPATLESYNKKQSVEQMLESVRILHEHKIQVHGMFVLGSDEDDVATIRGTARFALRNAIDTVQFLILTPLPGTRQFRFFEETKRIFTGDWSLYDGHHVVFDPNQMNASTLQREVWKAQKRFYSSWRSVKSFARLRFSEGLVSAYGRAVLSLSGFHDNKFIAALKRRDRSKSASRGKSTDH